MAVVIALVAAARQTGSPLEVSLRESGARDDGHMVIVETDFSPRISTDEAIAIGREYVKEMNLYHSPEEFPVFVSKARLWGWHSGRVQKLRDVQVRVVVFHDVHEEWRGPSIFPKPYPAEPRYTILIDDATSEVVQRTITFGRPEE